MITFKQFLEEAFNNPYPYKKVKETGSTTTFAFENFEVYIKHISDVNGTTYDVSFFINKVGGAGGSLPTGNSTLSEAMRIYATVIKVVDDFLATRTIRKGDIVLFVAVSNKTYRLYEKYTKYLSHKYGMESVGDPSYGWFQLVKK